MHSRRVFEQLRGYRDTERVFRVVAAGLVFQEAVGVEDVHARGGMEGREEGREEGSGRRTDGDKGQGRGGQDEEDEDKEEKA